MNFLYAIFTRLKDRRHEIPLQQTHKNSRLFTLILLSQKQTIDTINLCARWPAVMY